jgi:glycosyltransferase involved in cell wall biosynthesis
MMTVAAERSIKVTTLTIAIPAYNRSSSVQTLLKSICDQADSEDELVVSDDGSTDGTSEQASLVAGVRVIRHDANQGMVLNWNECLRIATRDWVCIIHDDDRLEPGALAALRRACTLANGPALILHQYAGKQFEDVFRCSYSSPNSWTVLNLPTIPSGAVVHRTIIDELGLFDARFKYSSDLEYFARIAGRFPVVVIESPRIVEYRIHGANYQLHTWRQPDFYDQLEELQHSIISHAGIRDENRTRDILEKRMADNLLYMLNLAHRIGDRDLVRKVGKRCRTLRHGLSVRQQLKANFAAVTGRCPR